MSILNALLFALVAFAGSFVVLGAAWVAGRGRAAAVRHLIWTGAFAVLLALPLAALLLPSQMTFLLPAAPVAADGPVVATAPAATGIDAADVVLALVALWFAGVLFHLGRLVVGGIGLIRLHRRSVAHIPHGIGEAPFRGLSWQLRLRTSPSSEAGPLTWGVLRPVVLLPKASVTWPRERLTSVLLHEAAHVRRKDCLCRLIAMAASALYWPNPLVWLAARAMRADAERAADDAVLTAGVKPTRYAEHLVGLAREFSGVSFAMSLSMAERRMLNTRVEAILDPAQPRSGVTKMDVLKLGVAAVALTAGLALVRPSLAEEPAPAQKPAAAAPHQTPPTHKTIKHTGHIVHRGVVVADVDDVQDPPDPPEPPDVNVPPEPPAPPAPHMSAVPPVPPVPPVHALSAAQRAAGQAQAHAEARRAIAEARRALAEVDIHQTVQQAMKQAEQSMREAKIGEAEARKALARMDIDRVVGEAMRKAEIAMQKAEAAQARAERKRLIIEHRVTKDGDTVIEDSSRTDEE
ncbi:M56 family metallopeptidase [Rhizomicrobium electricum]|uniref:Peptidase M56 domain-containing protein n=1 Tax=Rhizomicrobium electricum TaxID=480070 RepID=A0ABN1EIC2_9PROT|nr:M56 family metallopeptidase [Rhizomicrobium electricum]NIJ48354.1 beta-lactamase regulating signal transducer with metallopeptidase domain [Rhizomicrobium electricum]